MRVSWFALAGMLAAVPAHAGDDRIGRGEVPNWVHASELMPVPDDASGPVFVRRQDLLVRIDDKGQWHHQAYRIRILHSSALQLGNLSIAWNPASGSPTVHAIRVHRGAETIDVLKATAFEILRREDQLEAARLDGLLTAVLRIPDLRVGDELEVALTTPAGDPTMAGRQSGILVLPPAPAPGRYRLGLSWPEGRETQLRLTPDMERAAARRSDAIDVRFDNPAAANPPKDAPLRYQWQRVVQFSDFADWQSISRHFTPLYVAAATLPAASPIRAEVARIAAAHATPMARAAAALHLVQQDVRYIYVGLGDGNLRPATAEETWQRRYGDCKGKTALLLALLGALGIAAEPVLVNANGGDDGLDEHLPLPQMFDHVLVRATIDGATYWLDGTMPPVVSPGEKPVNAFRWVLPLTKAGSPLERIGWQPTGVPDELNLFEIDARQGFDQPARVVTTSILRGVRGCSSRCSFRRYRPAS